MSIAEELPPEQVWFAINVSKGLSDNSIETETWIKNITAESIKAIREGIPWNLNTINFLMLQSAAYGPFIKHKHAIAMAPAELDEESKDLWKGQLWTTIILPNVFQEDDLQYPDWGVPVRYVCKLCNNSQHFKGSCVKCKTNGKPFTPTIRVRDWEGELT